MPIIMAQRGRRFRAKVAPEIATKNGYCATKKLHYYGVKLHAIASRIKGSLPIPICLGLTEAEMHDRKSFEQILPELPYNMAECYADKAYIESLFNWINEKTGIQIASKVPLLSRFDGSCLW